MAVFYLSFGPRTHTDFANPFKLKPTCFRKTRGYVRITTVRDWPNQAHLPPISNQPV